MSDIEREEFEQLHAIPSGAIWCENRDIYIHKNYSGMVLHPINESWEAFCEGVMWQAARAKTDACCSEIPNSCEPVYFYQEPEAVGSNKWREVPGRTLERQRQQSHFRGFKHRTLYTYPASADVPDGWKLVPVEPTYDIEQAGCQAYMDADGPGTLWMHTSSMGHAYKAMIDAAPCTPQPSKADGRAHDCRLSRAMDGTCMSCGSKQEQDDE